MDSNSVHSMFIETTESYRTAIPVNFYNMLFIGNFQTLNLNFLNWKKVDTKNLDEIAAMK